MLPQLTDNDWDEAFVYAGERYIDVCPPNARVPTASFDREDVISILAMEEGANDEEHWIIAGKLKDGRWFYLEAGCDYSGWDCQASGSAVVASTKSELIRFGIPNEARTRLKIDLSQAVEEPVVEKIDASAARIANLEI